MCQYIHVAGPRINSSMVLTKVSPRTEREVIFKLTFNVHDGPPTFIDCYYTNQFNRLHLNQNLTRSIAANTTTRVTLTLNRRLAGTYSCQIGDDKLNGFRIGGSLVATSVNTSISQVIKG